MEYVIATLLSGFMLMVFYKDATRFIIPNWLNGTLLLLFPLWWAMSPYPIDALSSLYGFLGVFAIGYIIFMLNVMGGGDIKLLAVLGAWMGWSPALQQMLLYMGIFGGFLALGLLITRKYMPAFGAMFGWKSIPRIFTHKEPVPYGLAIALAFLLMLWKGKVPTVPLAPLW